MRHGAMAEKKHDEGAEQTKTAPVLAGAMGSSPLLRPGVKLLITTPRDGVLEATLTPGKSIVVGRAEPADVCIPEHTLSRSHARFSLEGDRVLVEDLGSKFGIWLLGQRIERAWLGLGGEVLLCPGVTVQVFCIGIAATPSLVDEALFRKRLEDELARCEISRRPFALLAMNADDDEIAEVPQGIWATRLGANLRAIDTLYLYTSSTAMILLPESDERHAKKIARILSTSKPRPELLRSVGIAMFPSSGTTVDRLVDSALADLKQSARKQASPPRPFRQSEPPRSEGGIVGEGMAEVVRMATKFAKANIPVLVLGESGTGKELVASLIHHRSRRKGNFVAVNCGALPENLFESMLFGHEAGSFTGATHQHDGFARRAEGGTLFLDEIGDLPLGLQVKLLRMIQEKTITPIGAKEDMKVDARIIAATHRNLETMVKAGRFREDLWYRIEGADVEIPPLRERVGDIAPLCETQLDKLARDYGWPDLRISDELLEALHMYPWPGNVRELYQAIERAAIAAEGETVMPEHLPSRIRKALAERESLPIEPEPKVMGVDAEEIRRALQAAKGNQKKAAEILGVSYPTVRRWVVALGIEVPRRPRGTKK